MNKVHGPCLVDLNRISTVISEFGLNATLWSLVPQLQTHFFVKAINPYWIDHPTFTSEEDVNTTIVVMHTRLTDIPDLDL
jgi:fructose-1-phosphate kinase PfkB-like protein